MTKKSEIFRMRLELELQRKLKKQAEKEQRTMASLIRFAIVQYLEGK